MPDLAKTDKQLHIASVINQKAYALLSYLAILKMQLKELDLGICLSDKSS